MAYFAKMANGKYRAEIYKKGIRKSKCFLSEDDALNWAKLIEARIEREFEELSLENVKGGALVLKDGDINFISADSDLIKNINQNPIHSIKGRETYRKADASLSKAEILSYSMPRPKICGVYFLILRSEIVYVGQSINVYNRIDRHAVDKEFDRITILEASPIELDEMELFYIKKFKPRLNVRILKSDSDLVSPTSSPC